ncbi:hypothetical protein PspLS_06951 [Pyricularia sp. CBS 133598]|nr:hypothetical protein PspLS_06951 [Pyricularia sp. CBS 133598]
MSMPPPPRPPYSGRRNGQVLTRPTTAIPENPSEPSSLYESPRPPSIPRALSLAKPPRVAYRGYSEAEVVGILRSLEDGRRTIRGGTDVSKTSEDGPLSPRKSTSSEFTLPLDIDDEELASEKEEEPRRSRSCRFGSAYQWIFAATLGVNVLVMVIALALTFTGSYRLTYQAAMTGFSVNLLFLHLVRNDHVVNAPFYIFGDRPQRIPFRVRYLFAKYYSVGGIHSGCGVAAALWYTSYLVILTVEYRKRDMYLGLTPARSHVYFVTYTLLIILFTTLIFSTPRLRRATQDWSQLIHRFLGWTIVLLIWIQTLLVAHDDRRTDQSYGDALAANPSFWILLFVTFLIIYPWAYMRKRQVHVEYLSDNCVKFNFDYQDLEFGQQICMSDAPLKKTYTFAVLPNPKKPADPPPIEIMPTMLSRSNTTASNSNHNNYSTYAARLPTPVSSIFESGVGGAKSDAPTEPTVEALQAAARDRSVLRRYHQHQLQQLSPPRLSHAGEPGFSVLTSSAAGEWSRGMIAAPPTQLYTVGVPRFGVSRVASMFEPVIVVATGCGIIPCLALFTERPDHLTRVIWAANGPLETFGEGVVETVLRVDPDAVIWDTRRLGRPDLVKLAWKAWIDSAKEDVAGPGMRIVPVRKAMGQCEAVIVVSNRRVTEQVVDGLEAKGVAAFGSSFESES